MTMEYRITSTDEFIRIECVGRTVFMTGREMLSEVAEISTRHKQKKLLFDLRGAEYNHAYADTIQHAEGVRDVGLEGGFRTALLGLEKDRTMLKYIEDVAVNRGFQVRAFVDEAQALEWIRDGRHGAPD